MMSFLKKIFFTIGLIFLVAVIFFFVFSIGNKIFFELNSDYIIPSVSAFMGAFFAFFFLIVGKWFSRFYSRHGKHRNALVKLEYSLNENAAINNRNIGLLKGLVAKLSSLPIMSMTTFGRIEVDKNIPLDLKNIDLINDLFRFNLDVDKSNQSLHHLTEWYNEVRQGFANGRIDGERVKQILEKGKNDLDDILKFLESFQKKIKKMLATARILLERESMIDWITKITSRKQNYPKNMSVLLEEESILLDKEFEDVEKASKKEIEELFGKSETDKV